jgi:hypothetical protein
MKHKSPDYKLSAVKYYLNNKDGYDNLNFECIFFGANRAILNLQRCIHQIQRLYRERICN